MLSLQGGAHRGTCDGLTRRDMLRIGGLAMGGLSLPQLLRAEEETSRKTGAKPSHKAVIMVFLAGGPSQFETFDPKPDAPSEIRGEFPRSRRPCRASRSASTSPTGADHGQGRPDPLDRRLPRRARRHDLPDRLLPRPEQARRRPTEPRRRGLEGRRPDRPGRPAVRRPLAQDDPRPLGQPGRPRLPRPGPRPVHPERPRAGEHDPGPGHLARPPRRPQGPAGRLRPSPPRRRRQRHPRRPRRLHPPLIRDPDLQPDGRRPRPHQGRPAGSAPATGSATWTPSTTALPAAWTTSSWPAAWSRPASAS